VAGRLAEVEGLFAHRAAAMIRIEDQTQGAGADVEDKG
jgi:hypothetical protein